MVRRPWQQYCSLPANDFVWIGFDGSEIMTNRFAAVPEEMYNSGLGKGWDKIVN